jgi:surface polysaccharide O-acyltransferase-like enzyme
MKDTCSKRHACIDQLRVAACVAVVLIHVTLGSLETVMPFSTEWWIGHWICLVSQWAVPVFVMISGALLLNPAHGAADSSAVFFRKRMRRIGWPLLVWTALYFGIRRVFDHEPVTGSYILNHLLQADPPYHTYFLFVIAGLYGVTPIMRILVQAMSSSQRQALIAVIFALASGYALANAWFWDNERFLLSFFVPYLGYYLCGYELTQMPENVLTRRHWLCAVGLSILYVVLIAPAYADALGRQNGRFVLGYFSVPVIVMSVALFRAAWQKSSLTVRQSDGLTEKLSRRIAPTTFGIYLVHVAVLICLREVATSHGHHSPFLVNVLVGTVLAFGLSYAITLLMQKIPGLRRLV